MTPDDKRRLAEAPQFLRRLLDEATAERDAAMAALRDIQIRAQSDGLRTFDRAIDDLVWIDDECRRVLAAHSAATRHGPAAATN